MIAKQQRKAKPGRRQAPPPAPPAPPAAQSLAPSTNRIMPIRSRIGLSPTHVLIDYVYRPEDGSEPRVFHVALTHEDAFDQARTVQQLVLTSKASGRPC
jgi:hypothetical protein